ncbi:MAG TPA: RHS repeat-associated core domain-containing protein, partial [Rhodanobacteraceae bacterium]|nr:RHS repeat-associated core domain-containing protein [Rhodanobacteraceae bacterium]
TGPASTWTQVWLKRGLLDHETLAINGSSYTVDYRYNTAGQLDSEEWPSGLTLNFAPDGLGRPTRLGTYAHDIGYAANGTVASLTYGNGATMERSPNARMLPGGVHYAIDGLDLTDRLLNWDSVGNLQMVRDLVELSEPPADRIFADGFELPAQPVGTDEHYFYYDSLDRLIMMVSPRHGTETFGYDPLGNVHFRSLGALGQSTQSTSYHYDTATNRIEDIDGVTVGYDTRGNVTSMQGHPLTWNYANELIGDFQGTSYAYDARGWRLKKVTTVATDGGHDRTFIYDHKHRLIERIDNGVVTDFVSLGAVPVARITGGQTTYILPDYQNTPLFELDSAGNITRSPDFLSYGRPVDAEGQGEIPSYTGAAGDPATGFLYLGARYMSFPRFLSVDPAPLDPTSPTGLNRYAYANDNPARYTDPFGLYACGSKVSSADCTKIDKFVGKVNQSLEGLNKNSNDYKSLLAVSKFLGTKNDGNGVTIETASLGKNIVAQPGGLKTLQLDMEKIAGPVASSIKSLNHGMTSEQAGIVAGGSTVAHETQHLIDANQPIFDAGSMSLMPTGFPSTSEAEMATEMKAYGIEGAFGRGLGVDTGYSTSTSVRVGAEASTSSWCTAFGGCQ